MPFQAITEAPVLREGIRLSFMAIPQEVEGEPAPLDIGALVSLRLGHCCPRLFEGRITALTRNPARAVLTADGRDWALEPAPGDERNAVPGIRSEVWCVR